jgi:hypothetical protein
MKIIAVLSVIVLLVVLSPVLLIGSFLAYNTWHTYTHRVRLTVEVETPTGLKSASGVIQNSLTSTANWFGVATGGTSTKGDAVFVDLGNGRHVIALLAYGPRGEGVDFDNIVSKSFGRDQPFWYVDAPHWTGKADVPTRVMPTLVTFSNLADPTTAKVLSPSGTDFETTFGPGYAFTRATLEMVSPGIWPLNLFGITGEPVTRGIEGKVPALKNPDQWNAVLNSPPWDRNRLLPGSRSLTRNF